MKKRYLSAFCIAGFLGIAVIFTISGRWPDNSRAKPLPGAAASGNGFGQGPASIPPAAKVSTSKPTTRINSVGAPLAGSPVMVDLGLKTDATAKVGDRTYQLQSNQIGNYQRVHIEPGARVSVRIAYPQGQAGDPVTMELEDGGTLDQSAMGAVAKLDARKAVNFNFAATTQSGIYRVLVRNGTDVKVLNFWAGEEPQLRD